MTKNTLMKKDMETAKEEVKKLTNAGLVKIYTNMTEYYKMLQTDEVMARATFGNSEKIVDEGKKVFEYISIIIDEIIDRIVKGIELADENVIAYVKHDMKIMIGGAEGKWHKLMKIETPVFIKNYINLGDVYTSRYYSK